MTGVVTGTGAFDLHDVGAQVAERHRRERPRQHAGGRGPVLRGRRGRGLRTAVMWCSLTPAMRDPGFGRQPLAVEGRRRA